jgi:ABC-type nitrate/sulfonate/bicarbonate transport system ATPase subunit
MRMVTRAPVEEPESVSSEDPLFGPSPEVGGPGTRLAIEALSHRFGELRVLERIDLDARPGSAVGIVGPSGCGKSTLLELIAGLRSAERGGIAIGEATTAPERLRRCAYMPQRDLLLPWLSAIDNAALALRNRGLGRRQARAAASPLFARFGLEGFESVKPGELSGGMRQRVAFLRTLLAGKPLLLLDEPFAGLDAITRGEMQEWLAGALAADARTVVLVTHDVEEALYLCDAVAVLSPRPATVLAELRSPAPRELPRIEAITTAAFARARERALEALAGGRR